jgi:hypothetical protein
MPHLLRDLPSLADVRRRLEALGLDTLEQFQAAAHVARPELDAYLGVPVDTLLSQVPVAAEIIPQAALETILRSEYPLGVDLSAVPRLMTAPPVAIAEAVAGDVNLIPQMPPVRDQGNRSVCVAFATLAAYEQSLRRVGAEHDFSEQFLYWNAKTNDGIPQSAGTYLGVTFPLLQRDGCCLEESWPYVPNAIAGNECQGPPPAGSQLEALGFRISHYRTLAPAAVLDFLAELHAGRSIAFSAPVFNSWYRSVAVAYSGAITMPIPGEVRVGGHAMCIVGSMEEPARPEIGGGRFLLRNSWGTRWGINCPYGQGYGTIPYAYIARFGVEAYAVG